jgi:CRISPR/Cas system-associated protein Cas10 (large subunit of type III CRISPR-Cas system)
MNDITVHLTEKAKDALQTFIKEIQGQFKEQIESISSLELSFKHFEELKADEHGIRKGTGIEMLSNCTWDNVKKTYVCKRPRGLVV